MAVTSYKTRRLLDSPNSANTSQYSIISNTSQSSIGRVGGAVDVREGTQSARKHKAIVEAATALFMNKGYQGTSVDEIAALAEVGKQTLFSEIILGNIATAEGFTSAAADILRDTRDLEQDLREVARRYLTVVMQPSVLQLRRLIIAEADRFPDLARTYYERVPGHTLTSLGSYFQDLAERGLLQTDEPALAASQFAWLVLAQPLNQAMFCGYSGPFSRSELDRLADAAVRVFLAAYPASDPGLDGPPARRGQAAVATRAT